MQESSRAAKDLDLTAFVENTERKLAQFCRLMGGEDIRLEDLIDRIYRRFSKITRRGTHLASGADTFETVLFRSALDELAQLENSRSGRSLHGRDHRIIKAMEVNLLDRWREESSDSKDLGARIPLIADRLKLLDFEVRAPVVLSDNLGLESEQILKILGLRWAVFRHRLHRGRVELQRTLRGVQLGRTH